MKTIEGQFRANPVQTALTKPDGITQKQERFAQHYVAHGSVIEAYRHAYDVSPSTNRNSLRSTAYNVLNTPKVRARVSALQAAMSERTLMTTGELIADLEAMACADVNEIMSLTVGACRHCHGERGAYQWRTVDEWMAAIEDAQRKGGELPSCNGGFGYRTDADPNPDCPSCDGAGVQRVRFTNTAEVSPGARKLYRGVELYQDGTVKRVLLNDPLAARMELHRLRGLHIERSMNLNLNANVPALKDLTPEQAMAFLDRLKPLPSP